MKFKRNTLLWIFGIALVVINQLFVSSMTSYSSIQSTEKVMVVVADVISGIVLSTISTLMMTVLLAAIPVGGCSFIKRFIKLLPIGLIVVEIITFFIVYPS